MTRTINLDKVAEQVDHYAYIARVIARRETDGDEKRRLLLSLAKET